jgi:hypothetical protein
MAKKNWIYWRRTWFLSLLEIVLPVLLMSVIVITRREITA